MTDRDMEVTVWTAQGTEMDRTVSAAVRTTISEKTTTVLPAPAMK
jgi:hypothetical protein